MADKKSEPLSKLSDEEMAKLLDSIKSTKISKAPETAYIFPGVLTCDGGYDALMNTIFGLADGEKK